MWQLSTRRIVYFTIASDGDKMAGNKLLAGFNSPAVGDAAQIHKAMAKGASFNLAFSPKTSRAVNRPSRSAGPVNRSLPL